MNDIELRIIALDKAVQLITELGLVEQCSISVAESMYKFLKEGVKDE